MTDYTRREIWSDDERKFPLSTFNKPGQTKSKVENEEAFAADYTRECEVFESKPVVNATGLCGPCTFGEADTVGGNW